MNKLQRLLFISLTAESQKQIKKFRGRPDTSFVARIINSCISSLVLVLCSPLMIIISIVIKCQDGGDIFYRGERYGYKKNKFIMYKFRTLVPNAEALIGDRLLKPGEKFETKVGEFLRDTHLDELPQLFNIINGSMAFFGPRPERPAVYEKICRGIPNYDKRFNVKPGAFGYSQLYTPYGTDKRMRAFIDNHYIRGDDYFYELQQIFYAFFILVIALYKKTFKVVSNKIRMFFKVNRIYDLRRFERNAYDVKDVRAEIGYSLNGNINKIDTRMSLNPSDINISLININEEALLVEADQPISFSSIDGNTVIKINIMNVAALGGRKKIKVVYSVLTKCVQVGNSNRYILFYKIMSSLNQYKVEKYLLNKSVI